MDAEAPPLIAVQPVSLDPREGRRTRRATIGWGLAFGFLCLLMIVVGLETALHFLGPPIDGPFQLYNSLRRIWAGQRAGVDFQFFHGMGIPYLHYLPFRLFGGTFIASEVTRELTSAVIYPLSILIFLRFFIRDWTRTLAWSTIVMAASIGLRLTSLLVAVNSLLGIRSTIPTLLPVVLCLPLRRSRRVALGGVALGGALVMGTEQGLAAAMALVLATAAVAWASDRRKAYAVDCAAMIGLGVVTLLVTLTALGGVSGMRGALAYNFRLVPLDQYWYFGTPPNLFLSSWGAIPKMLAVIPRIPITLLLGIGAVVLSVRELSARQDAPSERVRFAFAVLALYGLISCASLLGTYANAYVQPLLRVLLLLAAVRLDRALPAWDARQGRRLVLGVSRSVTMVAIGTGLIMVAVVPSVFVTTFVTLPHVVKDHVMHHEGAVYSGIWPATLESGQALFDANRNADGSPPTLWSTYAGLLEARNGLFQPSVDYIIHALGPVGRAKYLSDFERLRPQLVQTVMPTYTQYEPWIEGTSWDFYAALLHEYTLIGGTPWSLFWKRNAVAGADAQQVWAAALAPGATSVDLPAAPGTDGSVVLLQAELTYTIQNPLHVLPVVGAIPRYLVYEHGALRQDPVSLDPYTTTARFPIVAQRGKSVRLSWSTFSLLPGASIQVTGVRLWFVPVSDANTHWLADLVKRETGEAPAQ
jgi:hypothetical protein